MAACKLRAEQHAPGQCAWLVNAGRLRAQHAWGSVTSNGLWLGLALGLARQEERGGSLGPPGQMGPGVRKPPLESMGARVMAWERSCAHSARVF